MKFLGNAIGGIAVAVFLIFLAMAPFASCFTCHAVSNRTRLVEAYRNKAVIEDMLPQYQSEIMTFVERYPAEENLFKNLNPLLLLSVPEIKSDKVLSDMLQQLLSYRNELKNERLEINNRKRLLDFWDCWPWFLCWASTDYSTIEQEWEKTND